MNDSRITIRKAIRKKNLPRFVAKHCMAFHYDNYPAYNSLLFVNFFAKIYLNMYINENSTYILTTPRIIELITASSGYLTILSRDFIIL